MKIVAHLERNIDPKEVKGLFQSLLLESSSSLYINPFIYPSENLIRDFPKVRPHPFLNDVFYFPKEYNLGKKILFELGCYYIQDASATIVPSILDPQENERILDMCASPGGKAIRIATLMNNTGLVVANDNSFSRVLTLSQNVERFGLVNVMVTTNNFLYFVDDYENYFDRVLCDAPCSGSGMARKEPKMLNDWSENKVLKLTETQEKLLDNAVKFCKPGGIIVYSTCSFSYEENEEIIIKILAKGEVELLPIEPFEGSYHHPKLSKTLRLHPNRYQGEGQFAAKLRKKQINQSRPSIKIDKNCKQKPLYKDLVSLRFAKYYYNIKNDMYVTSYNEDLKFLQHFKSGMELGKREDFGFIYHHEASRLVDPFTSIPLTEKQAEAYIRGEELELNYIDGWHTVKYKELNLGWVRIKNKRAKNHYPKGLRRNNITDCF